MLRVLVNSPVVFKPQVLSVAPALSRCLQVRLTLVHTRALATLSPWKGGIPVISLLSHPMYSTALDFRIRQHGGISSGRQLRLNSTANNKSSVVHNDAPVARNIPGHEPERPLSSIFARITAKSPQGFSSFTKIAALAKSEKKPLLIAVGLLFMSASVSMSIPFTIGRLIDFFSSPNPVRHHLYDDN